MRREETKYLAAPVYVLCGYLVLQALGAKPGGMVVNKKGKAVGPAPNSGCSTNFVLVWVITTALSLVSAPLVEPRYCIIPWMMWRLRVPVAGSNELTRTEEKGTREGRSDMYATVLETLWFIVIAIGTGYMFLYRGFTWPQEPGKVQRFMW